MLETIKREIAETRDRQAVMILLQGVIDFKLAVLHIKTPNIEGELWFANGKYLVFGKANPGGELPLLDMLRLLAIQEGDFELEVRNEEPPKCEVTITIAELVADEHAVARKIKNVLWPVDSASNPQLEEEELTKERLRRLETTKDYGTDAKLAQELAENATAADTADKTAKEEEKPKAKGKESDFNLDETVEINLTPEKRESEPAPTDKSAARTSLETDLATFLTAKNASLDFSPPLRVDPPANKQEETVEIPVSSRKQETQEQSGDSNDEQEATVEIAVAVEGGDQDKKAEIDPEETTEVLKAKDPARAVSDKETAQSGEAEAPPENTPASEAFYARDDSMKDDIAERRAQEMKALNHLLKKVDGGISKDEAAAKFAAEKSTVLPGESSGKLTAKRRADYEALKTFYSEDPEKFYDQTEIPQGPPEGALDDFKKRILEIASQELSDQQGFAVRDPRLKEGGDIRPVWTPEEPEGETPGPAQPQLELPPPPEVPEAIISPYSEMTSALVHGEAGKTRLQVGAETDDLSLFERQRTGGAIPSVKEAFVRRQPLPKRIIIAAVAGAALIPLVTFIVWHYFDAQAQEESAEQREAALLAERSIEEKSLVAKPKEAFRMPAGGVVNPSPPSAHGGGPSQGQTGVSSGETSANFSYQPANNVQPIPPSEQSLIESDMQKADAFAASGMNGRAVEMYCGLLRRYPSYAKLRVKAARAMIAGKQYREAYNLCVAGLSACTSRSDFDTLVGIIRSIPTQ
jgi:hypothetical protein